MSATLFRKVSRHMFADALLCASAHYVTAILLTSYSCYLAISFRCVDVRGLRKHETLLSLLVLVVICHLYRDMK
jgi:hypothetical protein